MYLGLISYKDSLFEEEDSIFVAFLKKSKGELSNSW